MSRSSVASLVLCGVLAAALRAGAAIAGSYMNSEGEVLYVASLGTTTATQAWDRDGNLQDASCRSEYTGFSHFVEYGYSYYFTLFGQTSLATSRCGAREKSGLSDIKLGVRGRLNLYMNERSWEVEATLPTNTDTSTGSRLGCGVYGLAATVNRKDRPLPWMSVGAGAGVQFWQSPLSHQFETRLSASGPFARYWDWGVYLRGELPLSNRAEDPTATIDDCGTQSSVLRSTAQVKYDLTQLSNFGCGISAALIGEDVSRSRGFFCAYSRRWQ